jgi:hypothetical protein
MNYTVQQIPAAETHEWLLRKHYARRIPSISWAFGLFDAQMTLQGICTFGTPSSSPLRDGIAGELWGEYVLELNRLCCVNSKNVASYFISHSIAFLPKPKLIVSYADIAQSHHGYIYQATNFIYTGISAKRTDWKIKGKEHLHGQTIADESRGQENRAEWMREKYGDDFYLEQRPRKHRYVYLHGDKRQKRAMLADLRYKQEPYPKGDNQRYDASYQPTTQGILF